MDTTWRRLLADNSPPLGPSPWAPPSSSSCSAEEENLAAQSTEGDSPSRWRLGSLLVSTMLSRVFLLTSTSSRENTSRTSEKPRLVGSIRASRMELTYGCTLACSSCSARGSTSAAERDRDLSPASPLRYPPVYQVTIWSMSVRRLASQPGLWASQVWTRASYWVLVWYSTCLYNASEIWRREFTAHLRMGEGQTYLKLNQEKHIPRSDVFSLLRTYNCYHEGKNFQLRAHEEEGGLLLEGLLNIYWGLRRPIRLQMHDDHERFCPSATGPNRKEKYAAVKQLTAESNNNSRSKETEPDPSRGAARWGVGVGVGVEVEEEEEDEADAPQLLRTRSDASFMEVTRRRSKTRSNARDLQRLRTHRFSINGHFYNHK
ncbi:hypothetical protein CRUP_038622, partial [Coryphaenoides rupestris]